MRLLLLDDHTIVRAGLRLLLEREDDIDAIDEASSLAEALAVVTPPDVIVADLRLGDASGAAITTALLERFPTAQVLVLTMVDTPADVEAVLRAGARGYMLKEAAATELVDAVRNVARGEDYLQPALGFALARRPDPSGAQTPLSHRERDVLRLVAFGHTNAEIAEHLSVSVRTVESHRTSISQKLDLRTRAELVRYAVEKGIADFSS